MLVDELGATSWLYERRFLSYVSVAFFRKWKIVFVKPQTFMNLSGRAARKIVDFYKIDTKNLLVVHDEIDLPLRELKLKRN